MTRLRTRPNDLPLIAIPRLLANFLKAQNANASNACLTGQKSNARDARTEVEVYRDIEALSNVSILDYPPERLASSIVDLWQDLASAESCEDFLRYHRGWIAHAVLLGYSTCNVMETIERVIEVACCLDLLCQEHILAVTVVEALRRKAISRLTAWEEVQTALIQKMEEIARDCLAYNVAPETRFRATRDSKVEYWILSRAFVDEEHLMAESLTVQPQDTSDVESRITNLEAVLLTMADEGVSPTKMAVEAAMSDNNLSGIEDFTDTESSTMSSSDAESSDERHSNPVQRVARQTRDRVSRRLENLRNKVHNNAKIRERASPDIDTFSIPTSKSTLRSIDPLDQRTILRISATKDGNSGPRRPRPTATYPNEHNGSRGTASSNRGRWPEDRGLRTGISTDDMGRWKKYIGPK